MRDTLVWSGISLTLLLFVLGASFADAWDATSTSFGLRQDLGSIFGKSTSTSFGLFNAGGQTAHGTSSSSTFQIYSGPLYGMFPPTAASGTSVVVSAVTLNHAAAITLVGNATSAVDVNFTVTHTSDCSTVFSGGNVTTTIYRSGVGSSCTASDQNCYRTTTVASHNCSGGPSANATATIPLYYFAQATDASSTYSGENWIAFVQARGSDNASGSDSSSGQELNTLVAITITTSSLDYGSLAAGANSGSSNTTTTVRNVGNSSSTLQIRASSTPSNGGFALATSSQHYATSSFTYGGVEQALSGTAAAISGFTLTAPTSTEAVQGSIFWGIGVGTLPTGTYSGVNVFTPIFAP